MSVKILGIESSCDETAASVSLDGFMTAVLRPLNEKSNSLPVTLGMGS